MKNVLSFLILILVLNSCVSKKEIIYLQDSEEYNNTVVQYSSPTIQPNDILSITVGALQAEAALPYNRPSMANSQGGGEQSGSQLEGYIVTEENSIEFPQLGKISTRSKTTYQLQQFISEKLEEGGHLKNPTVNVRLLNGKVTILGEVQNPGTFTFSEQNITLFQALGYAGDLNINGKRQDVLIMREADSLRQITHVDLTSAELLTSPFYHIQPNDLIVVNPNDPKIKSAGYVSNVGTLISVFSILLSTIILITR